ncbi:MAG: DUF4349 domain-containing protein [Dehalococcoidia bacterium]|nr:DUF4349 domain-containing protein [Dehalococcoidia bacterium]
MSRSTKSVAVLMFASCALLAGCGGAAAPTMVAPELVQAQPPEAQPPPEAPAQGPSQPAEGQAPSEAVVYRTGPEQPPVLASDRLIIKDANIKLLVENTDVAIDGVMQVVDDVGGYMLSSRIWYQPWGEENYKYASITIGVPAAEFERAIRRLRALAIRVLDETSTGEDVTDQYVDLQSRLESLQATRSRILEFLDRARTVEEALTVNEELAAVEAQIEEIQGRINYLAGRAAFSTITVQIEPQLPEIVPTPTPTATPTATPVPWDASATFQSAKVAVTTLYQFAADLLIWIVVVAVPVLGPIALLGWLIARLTRRPPRKPPEAPSGGA